MKLFFREYGQGQPLIILHGLFGSSDNWLTQAKLFSTTFKVYTVDQRNHGLSPHSEVFDYMSMVDDLCEFFDDHKIFDAFILGHSMGGKTAMNFAISNPTKVKKLVVVDISPRAYDLEHYSIVEGLKAIPINTITSRNEADSILSKYIEEIDTRQFLLKNLQRKSDGRFVWKINLAVISEKLNNIGLDLQVDGNFEKPALFIRGARSNYITDTDWNRITRVFPLAQLETMETGHWVQAEKPQEFADITTRWLNA
ncbi:MAG: alpha/beta fold hydrolase [Cyclobacteriaceae bacterium]|jgi:pimeloyl-ACP methyl ester carboxylesterase|nr:alpha/beta fold hydrolase [Cyclobacteriaceae bacterium]MDH4295683.1 alpha/beta fold hydrolase [Cyclobacteriaceae bacterium]MDH5247492.1 alpha/beta fold hydrolase [Cyclobacteriaceae bacterium]